MLEFMWDATDEKTQAYAKCSYDTERCMFVISVTCSNTTLSESTPALFIPVNSEIHDADLQETYNIAVRLADKIFATAS